MLGKWSFLRTALRCLPILAIVTMSAAFDSVAVVPQTLSCDSCTYDFCDETCDENFSSSVECESPFSFCDECEWFGVCAGQGDPPCPPEATEFWSGTCFAFDP